MFESLCGVTINTGYYCKNEVPYHEQSNRCMYLSEDIWSEISIIYSILDQLNRGFLHWSCFFPGNSTNWIWNLISMILSEYEFQISNNTLIIIDMWENKEEKKRREKNRYISWLVVQNVPKIWKHQLTEDFFSNDFK